MNAKQKKSLLILTGLVAALLVVLLIVLGLNRNRATRAEEEAAASAEEPLTATDAAYSALSYTNGDASLSFAKGDDGKWHWVDDAAFPLDDDYITKILNTISGLTPQQTITQGDTLSAYGLESPSRTLTATTAQGDQLTFALGAQVAGDPSGNYYLLMNGDASKVYVITSALYDELSNGIYDMISLPELPVLEEKDITSITVTGAQETMLTSTVSTGEDGADASASAQPAVVVSWRSGGGNVTSNDDAIALISEVSALSIEKCRFYKPSEETVAQCGFAVPSATVSVAYAASDGAEDSLTLTVGGALADGSGYYVRVGGDATIYFMTTDSLATILAVAASGLRA